jgi:Flp pilus assembly protein TadD/spermidine synthase
MISPVAAKMAVERSTRTGQAIGNVSAWGVVGSILGTFATGYYLIAAFGTTAVVWGVAGTLAICGILFGWRSLASRAWAVSLILLGVLGAGPTDALRRAGESLGLREKKSRDDLYVDDSQYAHIRIVRSVDNPDRRYFHLDKLVHSVLIEANPLDLDYGYTRIYAEATRVMASGRDSLHTLTIGGGGYMLPRWIDANWPKSRTVVAEIDPAVTRAAIAAFALSPQNRLVIVHEDGRAHLQRIVEKRRLGKTQPPFDFIYLDVFDDYSVPYQLTTLEFMRLVDQVLAPDGAFLLNMIDSYAEGRFLSAMVNTMSDVFPHLRIFVEGGMIGRHPERRNTYVIVGSKREWDSRPLHASYDPARALTEMTDAERIALVARSEGRRLTDDWAPIENLLAPVVRESSRDIAASMLAGQAGDELARGHTKKAIRLSRRALELHPLDLSARRTLASALAASGDAAGSVREYQEMLRVRPSMIGVRVQLALELVKQGRARDALAEIENAIGRDPNVAEARFAHGMILDVLNRPDEAISAYGQAVTLDPKNLEARNNLGIALAKTGRTQEAAAVFQEVLRLDPNFTKARTNLQALAERSARGSKAP